MEARLLKRVQKQVKPDITVLDCAYVHGRWAIAARLRNAAGEEVTMTWQNLPGRLCCPLEADQHYGHSWWAAKSGGKRG